ncbi:MAG: SulP family inorganic anion transporter [Pyrinomonadaceae bacterium]|nr:SulP family inorganic anion transporter [Pyrinomonadaceae bacterium]
MSLKDRINLNSFSPFWSWLKGYDSDDLSKDFIAGLTVAVVLIPQVMAYATLAGLPPVHGLYAAFLGTAVAALWGSSRHLSTGPVALVSFLTLTALVPLAKPESPEFIGFAIVLAMIIGLVQLLMGVFRLGFILNFISHSVIAGFTIAAAIIIASTQIPSLFGFSVVNHEFVFLNFYEIFLAMPSANFLTAAIGISSVILIISAKKKISKAFPAALTVMVAGILLSYFFDLEGKNVAVVGDINARISLPSIPKLSFGNVSTLLPSALIIAIIGLLEAFAVSKTICSQTKQKLDVNQELVGQGLGNIASSLFKGYPIAGSFSRTAVNFAAGAVSGISSVFVSLFVLITILFLTEFLYFLPKAILAAVVIAALVDLIEFSKFTETFKLSGTDGIVISVTFLFSFLLKPDDAIFIGIVVSLVLFLRKTINADVVELVFQMGEERFKKITFGNQHLIFPDILIFRIDMSIFFANATKIANQIDELVEKKGDKLEHIVINFSGVNYVDVSGCEELADFFEELRGKGLKIYSMYRKKQVRDIMRRSGLQDHLIMLHDIKGFKKEFIIQKNPNFLVK